MSEPTPAKPPGRLSRALPALVVLFVLLVLVLPALDPALQLYDRDTARCEAPFKWEIWRRLALHQLPLWVTWTESGTSLLGQMTPGLFHPATLLFLLPLDFELLFKLQHLLALPLCAMGFFLFARWSGAERYGAAGGAVAYAGSGWVVSNVSSNLHYALGAAAIPFALHGLARFLETRRPLWLLWGAFALACPILGGEPQSTLFAGLIGLALAVGMQPDASGWHANGWRTNGWRTNGWRRLPRVAAWGLAALALSAAAALPVALRLRGMTSPPGHLSGRDYFQLPAWRLPGLAIPGAFDETLESTRTDRRSPYAELTRTSPGTPFAQGITLGAPLLLLALFAPRRKRGWLLGAAGVCALASLGPALPVDAVLLKLFPPFGWFRMPEKWLAPLTFFVALAGALGASEVFEAAQEDARRRSRRACLGAAGSALALALLALSLRGLLPQAEHLVAARMIDRPAESAAIFVSRLQAGLWIEVGLLAALAAVAASLVRGGGPRLAPVLGALILGTSALANSQSLLYTMPLETLRAPAPIAALLRSRADQRQGPLRIESMPSTSAPIDASDSRAAVALWRIHALATEDNAFSGVESIDTYSSLDDTDYRGLLTLAPELMRNLFDAQFQLHPSAGLTPERARALGFELLPFGLALRQRPPSPRAFLLHCAEARDRLDAVHRLAAAGFDPHRIAIVQPEDTALLGDLDCAASATSPLEVAAWTRPAPEEIEVDVEARSPALLLLAEHFDPGWSVSIDGAPPAPALHLDRAALGAKVSAGKHHLVFRFFPRGLLAGLACALGCALLLLLLELRWRRRSAGAALPSTGRSRA